MPNPLRCAGHFYRSSAPTDLRRKKRVRQLEERGSEFRPGVLEGLAMKKSQFTDQQIAFRDAVIVYLNPILRGLPEAWDQPADILSLNEEVRRPGSRREAALETA
jgi:hypothetical protein